MDRRLNLDNKLRDVYREVTGRDPEEYVWYQPPKSVHLKYPCILYKLSDMPPTHADNRPYLIDHEYELTVIDRDPISALREAIARLFVCRFVRAFESDGLHHYVFHIYD